MITSIHHVTFITQDLTRARSFYEGVLDLHPDPRRPQMSFDGVWYDVAHGQQIHLMLLPDPEIGIVRPAHGGRDRHVALGVKDIAKLKSKLEMAGIVFTESQSGRGAIFCRDADQNALEFIGVTG